LTTTHKTTTAPSLRAHATKKDKTVVESKAASSSKARAAGLKRLLRLRVRNQLRAGSPQSSKGKELMVRIQLRAGSPQSSEGKELRMGKSAPK
jgi:hypothetical protein